MRAEKIQNKFDLCIALTLALWTSLTLAVQNSWGGPDSSEKRDWFAGAISELIAATPDADVEYVEEFLLQIMNDEFDVNVDDGSGEEIAAKIVGLRKMTLQGDFKMVDEMFEQWQERQSRGGNQKVKFQHVETPDDEGGSDWDSDGNGENGEGEDMDIDEAPALVRSPQEKVQPKIDEEGFTEVLSRKKR